MPTLENANTYNSARQYMKWAMLTDVQKSAALLRAQDEIGRRFRLRVIATDDVAAQATYDAAVFRLAYDLAPDGQNSNEPAVRVTPQVVKESKELGSLKTSKEYSKDGAMESYPWLATMLESLIVKASSGGFAIGRLVR